MKNTCFFLLLFSFAAYSQTSFYFTPQWKVGDKKKAVSVTREVEYKKGELVEDTTYSLVTELTVTKEEKEAYLLSVRNENIALRTAVAFYEKMGEELPQYRTLELTYRFDKKTGKAELTNWKEAQRYMNQSFDQINALIKKKAPEMSSYTTMAFLPITEMFKSKENIEAYMQSEIDYLLIPYGRTFIPGDTLRELEKGANPFNPQDTIDQTTLYYLSNCQESASTCDINARVLLDLSEFKNMLKEMMKSMAKSFGVDEEAMNSKTKELDDFDMDITNHTLITFNKKTTWPVKVVRKGEVLTNDPKGKTEKTITVTTTIN